MSLEVSWALQTDKQRLPAFPRGSGGPGALLPPQPGRRSPGNTEGVGREGQGGLRYLRRWEQGASQHLASDKMNW